MAATPPDKGKRPPRGDRRRKPGKKNTSKTTGRKGSTQERVSKPSAGESPTAASKRRKLPRDLRRALQQQDAVLEKFGDASLEAIRTEAEGPPAGYIFVPKGDVYVTRNCRTRSHEAKKTVYTVYNPKAQRTLGLYIAADIHTAVALSAVATQDARTLAVEQKDARDTSKARALLRTQFPKMPTATVDTVLGHAFLKGSRRVGRSGKFEDEEIKVKLAVEAHIRHVHTEYEALLDGGMDREEARERVWGAVKRIKAIWAGMSEAEAEVAAAAVEVKKASGKGRNGRPKAKSRAGVKR
ncbi:hypothetical protein FQN53_009186 [Emmonsiellopsis sp. PD_33]|nr:hypothetical protein FQN53_009186 [Emmonsiellopsis sp. PD_33]KAK2801318.1 hypothetical protein FQN51_005418 [Onygenales sp. PD_10]